MSPLLLSILIPALLLGTAVTLTSSSWVVAWVGLELNTLAILPLMAELQHPRATEAAVKYFIVQAVGAATLLFAAGLNVWMTGEWGLQHFMEPVPAAIATLALALKLGLAPTHFWLPEVLQGLNLTIGLILSTLQKLGPFALLTQINGQNPLLLIAIGVISVLVGGWGGLNQTQLRKILAYSSIAHLGWMTIVLPFSQSIALMTLALYFVMTFSAFIVFKVTFSTNINSLSLSWAKSPALTAVTPLVLLSLGGLPPLSGFVPKWLTLAELSTQGLIIFAVIIALAALLSLFYYLRLCCVMAFTMTGNTVMGRSPWQFPTKPPLSLTITTLASFALLPVTPLAFAIFAH
nr:NADH dehydrogenase subunit 2 [Apogon quadrisquamatus]